MTIREVMSIWLSSHLDLDQQAIVWLVRRGNDGVANTVRHVKVSGIHSGQLRVEGDDFDATRDEPAFPSSGR